MSDGKLSAQSENGFDTPFRTNRSPIVGAAHIKTEKLYHLLTCNMAACILKLSLPALSCLSV